MRRSFVWGLLVATAAGCGGHEKSTIAPTPVMPIGAGSATQPTAAGGRVLDAVRADASLAGFVDAKRLREAGWFAAIMALPIPQLQDRLEALREKCGREPFGIVDQLAWSSGNGGLVVAAKLAVPAADALACLRGLRDDAEETTVAGRPALRLGEALVVGDQAMLVAGSESWVGEYLAGETGGGPLRATVTPAAGTLVRVAGAPGGKVRTMDVSLVDSPEHLVADVSLEMEDAATAAALAEQLKEGRAKIEEQLARAGVGMPTATVAADGARLRVTFDAAGSATKQAALLGTLSALAIYGVRRYLASSKAAEAKATVSAIGRALVAAAEREEVVGGKIVHRFPPSAPQVPKQTPHAQKYASQPSDWSHPSWRAIHFEMSSPQYYSYAFETAKDGMSAVVVAHGDLDGDGVESTLTIQVTIDEQGIPHKASQMVAENELE
jgi:type IV pilus assembly protein PilA